MKNPITPPEDSHQIRCRKLGHQISFSYCRIENLNIPCSKILECWADHFNAAEYLKFELTPDEWEKAFETAPKPKISTLLDLIEHAKKVKENASR
ncbi:MAG: hypothetical protein AB1659_00340 [Thermodesulfobacteriota bacterium]